MFQLIGSVSQQVESLQRCQSLEEVHRLHDAGDHQRVVTLLLQTFTHKGGSNKLQGEVTDRMEQLVLLQESLLKLEEYKVGLKFARVQFGSRWIYFRVSLLARVDLGNI